MERRLLDARVAGVQADEMSPGAFFAHDDQIRANDFAPECTHTRFGVHRRWGPVVRVNGGLGAYGPGVLAGEQTDAVLAGLHRTEEQIAALRGTRRGRVGARRMAVNGGVQVSSDA